MPRPQPLLVALCLLAACGEDPNALPAVLTPPAARIDFGRRAALAPPIIRALTFENTGGSASPSLVATLQGPGRVAFRTDTASSSCLGVRLAPATSCVVAVLLDGPASGPVSATLLVGGSGNEEPRVGVALTGVIQSVLDVHAQGTGHGWVIESIHNTSCVPECGFDFDVASVTLTAVPDPQSTFGGWVGVPGCSTDARCTLALIDLNAVTVRFDALPP